MIFREIMWITSMIESRKQRNTEEPRVQSHTDIESETDVLMLAMNRYKLPDYKHVCYNNTDDMETNNGT